MDLTRKNAITYCLLVWCQLVLAQCDSPTPIYNQSKIESEYNEKSDLDETFIGQVPEDYQLENSQQNDGNDYEPHNRNNFRPIVPYDYQSYGENYGETPVRPYVKKYQPYFLPTEQMETMEPKPVASPVMENQIKQRPVYANLYWRKIVYPYQTYTTQNSPVLSESNLTELQAEESINSNRRYVAPNPYKRYYKKRKRYPMIKTINGRPSMTAFYPMSVKTQRMRPNVIRYYKNPIYYQRRRNGRPIAHNYKNNINYSNYAFNQL